MKNKNLNLVHIFKLSIIFSFIFSSAEINSSNWPSKKIVDFCMNSSDFRKCIKDSKSINSGSYSNDEKDELDFLGLPKLNRREWMTIKNKPMNHIMYLSKKSWKIKVRGIYGRYLTYKRVSRMYFEPVPGTPTQITSSGISYTSCDNFGVSSFNNFDYGTTLSCTTYGPSITTTPGTPSIPGGVRQKNDEIIIDCLDKTYQTIDKKGRKDKWRVIEKDQMKFYAVTFCGKIDSLEPTNIRVYEKGSPNEEDLRAKNTLPANGVKRW